MHGSTATKPELNLVSAWGQARAALLVAFQRLETALQNEAEAQIRHIYEGASPDDIETYDEYRLKVAQAEMDYTQAHVTEYNAYQRYLGNPTLDEERAATEAAEGVGA